MPSTPRTSTWRMADRLVGGQLASLISECRETGLSWDDTSHRLVTHGVTVTPETLRRWARQLGLEAA